MDDVIRTPDEFRGSPDKYRSAGRVIGTTGEVMGLIGPRGREREEQPRAGRVPPHGPSPNWTRGRGGAPSFLLLLVGLGKGEPIPTWSRIPPLGAPLVAGRPLLPSFIYVGRGHPKDTTVVS